MKKDELSFLIENTHSYSPIYLTNIYKKIIIQEWWDENLAFCTKNKNKFIEINLKWIKKKYYYKQIYEVFYTSIMCLALNKYLWIKYNLILSDAPDVILINNDNCIPVEFYEAFEYKWKREKVDIKSQICKLYNKKFKKSFKYNKWTRLLILNRIKSTNNWFNVSEYVREINKYKWWFYNISLCLYNKKMIVLLFLKYFLF